MILYVGVNEVEFGRIGGIVGVDIFVSGEHSSFMTLTKDEVEGLLDILLSAQHEWENE